MFNTARLRRMKPSTYLVNTARGGIIDEAALYDALSSGRLAGVELAVCRRRYPIRRSSFPMWSSLRMSRVFLGSRRSDERTDRAEYLKRS